MNFFKTIYHKITKENPVFALFLGMCPILATSNSFDKAFGMSLAVIVVLIITNTIISAIRKIVPNEIRIPVYIIIIATVVTAVQMLMNAYMETVYSSLGVYLSLIVVNCIILGRAEQFASKNSVVSSIVDGLGIGLGFFVAIVILALFREILGTSGLVVTNPFTGKVLFGFGPLFGGKYSISILTQASGAFLVLGLLIAGVNAISISRENHKKELAKAKAKEEGAK